MRVPLDASTGTTVFQPWDEKGLRTSPGATGQSAVDTALAYTKIDGPRTDVLDTAAFWLDRWGAPIKVRDPLGNQTLVARGDANNPALITRIQAATGRILGAAYNGRGNLQSVTDSTFQGVLGTGATQPVTTSYVYGSTSVPDSPTEVDGPVDTLRITYDPVLGLPTLFVAQGGHRTAFQYLTTGPLTGLLSTVTDSFVAVVDTALWTKSSNNHLVTQLQYDAWGNDTLVVSPKGLATRWVRDPFRRVQSVYDPMGHQTAYGYDILNRIDTVSVFDSIMGPLRTRYYYNLMSTIDSVVDPRGVKRSWRYDAAARDTAMTDDLGNVEHRYFDRGGLVDSVTTRLGLMIRHTYDPAGRHTRTTYPLNSYVGQAPGDTILFTYDPVGQLLTATNHTATDSLTYNLEGTLRAEHQHGGGLDVTVRSWYDAGSRRTKFFNGTDSVSYNYGADSRLSQLKVTWMAGGLSPDSFAFSWDALGRRDSVRYYTTNNPTDVIFGYDQDSHLRMVCAKHKTPTGMSDGQDSLERRVIYGSLNKDGLVQSMIHYVGVQDNSWCGQSSSWTVEAMSNGQYDWRHDLLSANAQFPETFRYDSSSNMVFKETDGATTDSFPTSGRTNRPSARVDTFNNGTLVYTYDYLPDGNRKDEWNLNNGTKVYVYNAIGQFVAETVWAGNPEVLVSTALCAYDGLGRRVVPCGNGQPNVYYDGSTVAGGTSWRYVGGPGLDDPLVAAYTFGATTYRFFYLTDGRGRHIAFTDANGSNGPLLDMYTRNGGSEAGAIDSSHGFANTRAESPATPQLSYYHNRYYDQESGRFMQEDPIGIAGGLNLYAYVGNDPAAFTDPFGLKPDTLEGVKVKQKSSENPKTGTRNLCVDKSVASDVQATYDEAVSQGILVTFNNAYRDRVTGGTGGRPSAGANSDHLAGFAYDINSQALTSAQLQQFNDIAGQHGFLPVAGDRGHYEANTGLHRAYGSHGAAVGEATRSYAAGECVDANVEAVRSQQ